jgi:hypothetical protein
MTQTTIGADEPARASAAPTRRDAPWWNAPLPDNRVLTLRMGAGLLAGVLLAFLSEGSDALLRTTSEALGDGDPMPTIIDHWRIAAVAVFFATFALQAALGTMRVWSVAAWTVVVGALAWTVAWTQQTLSGEFGRFFEWHVVLFAVALFVAHSLVSDADQERRPIASYATYFENTWKRAIHVSLAVVFTALLFAILRLGAELFGAIGIDTLRRLLEQPYFNWPIAGVAFAAAVHLGDVQPRLLEGVRSLVLGVFSWLLPVLTLLGVIFVALLPVVGLESLWATNAAAASMLTAAFLMTVLINAAYQRGDGERRVNPVLRWSVRIAAVLVLVFSALAAWALGLRIADHGLTVARVFGLAILLVLAVHGIGYVAALFVPGRWMRTIESVNVTAAVVNVAVLVALLTPIAPPVRLTVADQIARLERGAVPPARFDWEFLAQRAGPGGRAAVERIAAQPDGEMAQWARRALDGTLPPRDLDDPTPADLTAPDLAALQVVFPDGGALPATFIERRFRDGPVLGPCLSHGMAAGQRCAGIVIELNRDDRPEVIILAGNVATFYAETPTGWIQINQSFLEDAQRDAVLRGEVGVVPAPFDAINLGGQVESGSHSARLLAPEVWGPALSPPRPLPGAAVPPEPAPPPR